MPFIGQQPVTGAYHKLDSITTSATATYNLQLNGGAYSPASANHLLVSLNGVIQAPQDSFTVSGSQITFASALTSSDNIDFIMAFGDVLSVGTPTDGSVNTSQLANSAVTDAKIASGISSSKLTGALPAIDGSALTGIDTVTSGMIVNVQYEAEVGGYNSITADTNSPADTGMSITYTPTNASNTIVVLGSIHIYRNASGHNHIYLYKGGSNVYGGTRSMSGHKAAGGSFHSDSPIFYSETAGDTSARTYTIYAAKRPSEGGTLYVNDGSGYGSYMMVMEIKA